MQFGCFVPQGWRHDLVTIEREQQWPTVLAVARDLERLGFDSLWVYDHFHTVPVPTQEVVYEAWSLMSAFAVTTSTIRLGQMCTSVGYRPPAYLAKLTSTIDVMSGGRLELGIGAGWYEHEYDGYGYPFPSGGARIAQLDEAVGLIKRMWTEDVVHHDGEHFHLDGAMNQPKPLQEPHPPVWIAGGGERKTLRVAAQHADRTNFAGDLETFTHKSQVLRQHCADLGTDFDRIVRSANYNVVCEESEADVEDRLRENADRLRPWIPDQVVLDSAIASYRAMAGTPEQLIERLLPLRDAGMTYAIANFAEAAHDRSGIERFATHVIPELRR